MTTQRKKQGIKKWEALKTQEPDPKIGSRTPVESHKGERALTEERRKEHLVKAIEGS